MPCRIDQPPRQRYQRGRELVDKMQELIPRQMFEGGHQAAIGRARDRPLDVKRCARTCSPSATAATSRASGKLLEKQKEGKKRMKQLARSEIPQEAFLAVLQVAARNDRKQGTFSDFFPPRACRAEKSEKSPFCAAV